MMQIGTRKADGLFYYSGPLRLGIFMLLISKESTLETQSLLWIFFQRTKRVRSLLIFFLLSIDRICKIEIVPSKYHGQLVNAI